MTSSGLEKEKPWLKFYHQGVPPTVEVPEKPIGEYFDIAANKWGDRPAIIFYGRKISYRELKDQVDRFATALSALGVKKGDSVACLLLNSPQFVIADLALFKLGAVMTPLSPVYVSVEVKHQLDDSGAKIVICQDTLYETIEKTGFKPDIVILTNVAEYLPKLKQFLGKSFLKTVYRKMELPPVQIYEREGFYRFQDLLAKYSPNITKVDINPKEDIALLPYSGGTTGLPKGIMLTHLNALANAMQNRAWLSFLQDGKDALLLYMPMYHIGGQSMLIMGLIYGMTLIIMTTIDLDDVLDNIETYKVPMLMGAPSIYDALKDYDRTDHVDWKHVKMVLSGADALRESTAKDWERRTGARLHETYGLTETSGGTHGAPLNRGKTGSLGIPYPNIDSAILDVTQNKFLPAGEIGEIVIAGPAVMKGYWRRPEETGNVLVEIEGQTWFRTGDLGSMDEEGYFYFYDRKKDMIIHDGHSVFAREVEEAVTSHPQVRHAGVVGIHDDKAGQKIKAYVVLEKEARGKLSEEEIVKYCEGKLDSYKVPRIIEFRGEIPLTDIGKVSRRELREEEG